MCVCWSSRRHRSWRQLVAQGIKLCGLRPWGVAFLLGSMSSSDWHGGLYLKAGAAALSVEVLEVAVSAGAKARWTDIEEDDEFLQELQEQHRPQVLGFRLEQERRRQADAGKHVPRCVMVGLEPSFVEEVCTTQVSLLMRDVELLSWREGCGGGVRRS